MSNLNESNVLSWRQFFGGSYFTADALKESGPTTYTIRDFSREELADPKTDEIRVKLVLYFEEDGRGLVLNKTTALCLDGMFGEDVRNWRGKGLTLYCDSKVRVGGRTVGGVRIAGSPDLPAPLKVRVKLPKRRAEELTMQVTEPSPFGAMLRALGDAGLTREDFDGWAMGDGRPPVSAMSLDQMGSAARWLGGAGADIVRKAAGKPEAEVIEPEQPPAPEQSAGDEWGA